MDSFESLVATLLTREGYWVRPSFKVELSKDEKRNIGRPSCPRWELDLVCYKGGTNEILVVECKSFLNSPGVRLRGLAGDHKETARYKLFNEPELWKTVKVCLVGQLEAQGACSKSPTVQLALAAGEIATSEDRNHLREHFKKNKWKLFDEAWLEEKLRETSNSDYENDVAVVAAKLLLRNQETTKRKSA